MKDGAPIANGRVWYRCTSPTCERGNASILAHASGWWYCQELFLFLLTWDVRPLHNIITSRHPSGWRKPAAVRGMARSGSRDGGWLCIASNGPRRYRCRLLWEIINRRNLYRAITNAYDAIGFLVGTVASDRHRLLVGSDRLREDVSIRPPTGSCAGPCAAIPVSGFALAVLSNHGSAPKGRTHPPSPVTSVSALLMHEDPYSPASQRRAGMAPRLGASQPARASRPPASARRG